MTNEQKQLLLADLCARLPYGVNFKYGDYDGCDYELKVISPVSINDSFPLEDCKPYLRPMSSMSEEEEREYNGTLTPLGYFMFEQEEEFKPIQLYKNIPFELYEFFIAHHFDFHGLIEKGLALEAPKGMYK